MSTTEPTKTISDYEATLAKADTAVASFEKDDKSIVPRLRNFLRKNPTMIPALVLLLSITAFSIGPARSNSDMRDRYASAISRDVAVPAAIRRPSSSTVISVTSLLPCARSA